MSKLLEALRLGQVDGSLNKFLVQLAKTNVLIIDDWGIEPFNQRQRNLILEIIEDRHGLQSTVLTAQLPIEHWHEYIGDNTIADAVLDRLLTNAEVITLKGKSMRQHNVKEH